ncbi:M15 family metallopeptidase [Metabacillus iocasae]|uniref:SPOR domain-containing protein n=1 Tax=Priestia iocasae TaxID=2291674 RepID=A0ABS2QVI6_9BACI|nr:M15 family metallopeptidase [Metabacillus iocasae]MBM7703495.1 hypothetical protein [Metabacillus iocasae]
MSTLLVYLLERSTKALEGVHPFVASKAIELVNQAYANGINIAVVSGYRSFTEQAKLYGQGRTSYLYNGVQYGNPKLNRVTNAQPGYSMHNYGLAFDIAVFTEDRKAIWSGTSYDKVGRLGQALGLEWGGAWKTFVDKPHFQYTFGLRTAQLRAGVKPPGFVPVNQQMPPTNAVLYRLTTGTFATVQDVTAAMNRVKNQFQWVVYKTEEQTELGTRYRLATGTFAGKDDAEKAAQKLRDKFGWTVYVNLA